MSLLNKLTQVAKSKQGQEMLQKAKTFANDPKTRAKLDEARGKFTEQVDAAKQKMAEKKAKDEADGSTAATGDAVADAPAAGSAPADDAPAPVDETPAPPADPAYGDDGPKAA